jgi:translation initiation factor 1 (eIF-1/SUI1)
MEKEKILNIYFEKEDVAVRIVSDSKKADIIVKADGSITDVLNEGIKNKNASSKCLKNEIVVSGDLEADISSLLDKMGIPSSIRGYRYIREAIMLIVDDPQMINGITISLYPGVAKKFDTKPSRVERAIRHAVEVAFDKGNTQFLSKFFECAIIKGKPTNSEFVFLLADKIRLEQKK